MARILVVDDDDELACRIKTWLEHEKHTVDYALSGEEALTFLRRVDYELVVLDWSLPAMSGVDVCRSFRGTGGRSAILMLTGKAGSHDKIAGLDAGADDYLTKPFELDELSARVRALLRRSPPARSDTLQVGGLTLDTVAHEVEYRSAKIDLSPTEFSLLEFLMRNPNRWFSSEALAFRVWDKRETSIDNVRTYIKSLRKKLGSQDLIEGAYVLGYRLVVPADCPEA
jgi:DNA-binding response OmpR family regulator